MYLKRVELQGFKSFADKTVVEFQPGVNGIVGPNGCGKSNITDAIRWVLGEKSAKALRGDAMTDVIFSGSEDRKAQNMAEVTLVFDNEDHYLPYESVEVEITRRLYRLSADGEYFINRQPCRLKDIVSLIMDTGLGKDSLSIISQNNINEFVQAKPIERRGLFEEAAGVAKYKQRKKESVSKLDRTTENLERVQDIVTELEKQLAPLKRQKEKAETYLQLKKELQEIEISVLVRLISDLSSQLKSLNSHLEELEQEKVTTDSSLLLKEKQNEDLNKKMFTLDQEINDLQGQLLKTMNQVSELETQKVEIDTNRKHLLESNDQELVEEKIIHLKAMLQDAVSEYNDRVNRYQQTKQEKQDIESQVANNNASMGQLRKQIESLNLGIHRNRAMKERMVDEIENKSGYPLGVRSILKAKNSLSGIVGVLGDLLESQDGYETALSIALGSAVQFIVTQKEEHAKKAIAFLRSNKAGRATFLPIEKMQPRNLREDHQMIVNQMPGYLGLMSDFVDYDTKIKQIVLNQLGNVIVADNIDHASAIARNVYNRYRVVTLAGDVINVGGSLTGGTYRTSQSNFSSKKELERLGETLEKQEKQYTQYRFKLTELDNYGRELNQALMQKQMSFAKLELVVTNKKNELQMAKNEYESLTHQSVEMDKLASEVTSNKLLEDLNLAKKQRDQLQEAIQTKREIRMNYVHDSEAIDRELKELRRYLKTIEHQLTQDKIVKAKKESEIQNYLLRLTNDYEMTFEHASLEASDDIEMESAQERVKELRMRIASLGNVNVDSIEQYKEVSSRFETLNKNRLELLEAQDTLLKAIKDMDQIMVERFSETFEAINKEFNNVFRYLFGGGHASLHYSDPDNILETGVEIEAQPPGKSAKLHSFSGGENALIALSCLFAIITVRPVPLCILDEVEAALDIANVERFAKYLKIFSDKSQFVVVTHREGTMAECDLLYGATMQQKGVTKLVSVQLKEATHMANA